MKLFTFKDPIFWGVLTAVNIFVLGANIIFGSLLLSLVSVISTIFCSIMLLAACGKASYDAGREDE